MKQASTTFAQTQSPFLAACFGLCLMISGFMFLRGAPELFASWYTIEFLLTTVALFISLLVVRARSGGLQQTAVVLWCFLICAEGLFVHRNGGTGASFTSGAYAETALWVLLLAIALVVSLNNPRYLRDLFIGNYKWLSLFAMLAFASSAYSPNPAFSAAWGLKLLLIVVILRMYATATGRTLDWMSLLSATTLAFAILCVTRIIIDASEPPMFIDGRLAYPIATSTEAGLLCLLSLWLYSSQRRGVMIAVAVFAFALALLGGGKTAILATLVSVTVLFVLQRKTGFALGLVSAATCILAIVLTFTPISSYFDSYAASDNVGSLTGRTELWTVALPLLKQHPLIGHGYVSSKFLGEEIQTSWNAEQLHNAWLEAFYDLGVVGFAVLVWINFLILRPLISVLWKAKAQEARLLASGALAVYIFLFLNGLTEHGFAGAAWSDVMVFYLLIVFSELLEKPGLSPRAERSETLHALIPLPKRAQ